MGSDDIRISVRAGAAARAKKASEDADQMEVARVSKPRGLSISVAGSSFIDTRNTRAAPISTPGRTSGTVTLRITWPGVRPSPRAASSSRGLTWWSDARVAPSAAGSRSTT